MQKCNIFTFLNLFLSGSTTHWNEKRKSKQKTKNKFQSWKTWSICKVNLNEYNTFWKKQSVILFKYILDRVIIFLKLLLFFFKCVQFFIENPEVFVFVLWGLTSTCVAIVDTASAFHKKSPKIPNRHLCLVFLQPFFPIMKLCSPWNRRCHRTGMPGNETLHKQF